MTDFKIGDRVTVAEGATYRTQEGTRNTGESGPAQIESGPDSDGDFYVVFDRDEFADDITAVSPEFLTLIESASDSAEKITAACDRIKELLLEKNRAYGDAAFNPVRIFSKADAVEQIKVRIDDKISRLQRGKDTDKVPEDTVNDLIGYLIILKIAEAENG